MTQSEIDALATALASVKLELSDIRASHRTWWACTRAIEDELDHVVPNFSRVAFIEACQGREDQDT